MWFCCTGKRTNDPPNLWCKTKYLTFHNRQAVNISTNQTVIKTFHPHLIADLSTFKMLVLLKPETLNI